MIEPGDKVKWNGTVKGEPMPAWLNTSMIGEVSAMIPYDTYTIGVWFADLYEVFDESELEIVK
jgi:hypothetical protein